MVTPINPTIMVTKIGKISLTIKCSTTTSKMYLKTKLSSKNSTNKLTIQMELHINQGNQEAPIRDPTLDPIMALIMETIRDPTLTIIIDPQTQIHHLQYNTFMIDLQLPIIKFKSFADEKMKLASSQDEWLNCLINTDSEWDISPRILNMIEELQLFENAEEINIKTLKLRWTRKANIMKTIEFLYFPNLKELFLNGNQIQSIEMLSSIDAPFLENLNLKQNYIHSVACLKKFVSPHIKTLSLYMNVINEFDSLAQYNGQKIDTIWVCGRQQIGNNPDALTWLAKLPSPKIKSLFYHQERAVQGHQELVTNKIKAKFGQDLKTKFELQDDSRIDWL